MNDNPSKFVGSRLKIQRAHRHVQELNTLMENFGQTDFCKVHVEHEASRGQDLLKIDFMGCPPDDIPVIVGDIVHNLKGALDHIANRIVSNDRMYFPKGTKRDDVERSLEYRKILKAAPEVAKFILDEVQPYQGGKCNIWELTDVDNIDKHRLLVPTLTVAGLTNVMVVDENHNVRAIPFVRVIQGRVVAIPPLWGRHIKVHNHGRPAPLILFNKGSALAGKPIIQTLHKSVQVISGVDDPNTNKS